MGGETVVLQDAEPEILPDDGFRWLHVSLADLRARQLVGRLPIEAEARELLLSPDDHQRALIVGDTVACVIHDFAREFQDTGVVRAAAVHFVLSPSLMVTARHQPVRCADIVRDRIETHGAPRTADQALDLLIGAVFRIVSGDCRDLLRELQAIEDALLDEGREPQARALPAIRRRAVLAQRQLSGLHQVFKRLEEDEDLPEPLTGVIARLAQRLVAIEDDIAAVLGQIRPLREELDLRSSNRTNQNLYVLSVLTALMLPATLVTGIFGMNTGGLPFNASQTGTLTACLIAAGSAGMTYLALRLLGFLGGSN